MRELSVYYCPQCGRYGYYQLVRNAVCHVCDRKMSVLDIRYPEFMRLNLQERQQLLVDRLIHEDPDMPGRILSLLQASGEQEAAAALNPRLRELEKENQELNDTVRWMHQTIWDLLRKNRLLEKDLEEASGKGSGIQEP